MGPVAITFGLGSAAAILVAALFSLRHNAIVAVFLFVMWGSTKVVHLPIGSDAQLYLDGFSVLLCGLLCAYVSMNDRRSKWPVLTLGVLALWEVLTAAYADLRQCGPEVKWAYQFARNVLYAGALFVVVAPGVHRGALVVRRRLLGHSRPRPRRASSPGWGRDAPDAVSRRGPKAR